MTQYVAYLKEKWNGGSLQAQRIRTTYRSHCKKKKERKKRTVKKKH